MGGCWRWYNFSSTLFHHTWACPLSFIFTNCTLLDPFLPSRLSSTSLYSRISSVESCTQNKAQGLETCPAILEGTLMPYLVCCVFLLLNSNTKRSFWYCLPFLLTFLPYVSFSCKLPPFPLRSGPSFFIGAKCPILSLRWLTSLLINTGRPLEMEIDRAFMNLSSALGKEKANFHNCMG